MTNQKINVHLIKGYEDIGNPYRQTPKLSGQWENVYFTLNADTADYVVVFNQSLKVLNISCPPQNIWMITQEPYVPNFSDWMVEDHNQYSKVFTHHIFNDNEKYIRTYPMLEWHINKSYDELKSIQSIDKTKTLSWITSNFTVIPGHKKRMKFMRHIQDSVLDIDIYGKGINFIEDKWDGLAPYKYAFAIENSSSSDYWTEKIADCFLSYTLPIYYGCTNIDNYFPRDSYIQIDINKPEEAIEIVKAAIEHNEYEKRYQAICEARELVLDKYNLFANIAEEINKDYDSNHKQRVNTILRPYKSSIKVKLSRLPLRIISLPNRILKKIKGLVMGIKKYPKL